MLKKVLNFLWPDLRSLIVSYSVWCVGGSAVGIINAFVWKSLLVATFCAAFASAAFTALYFTIGMRHYLEKLLKKDDEHVVRRDLH